MNRFNNKHFAKATALIQLNMAGQRNSEIEFFKPHTKKEKKREKKKKYYISRAQKNIREWMYSPNVSVETRAFNQGRTNLTKYRRTIERRYIVSLLDENFSLHSIYLSLFRIHSLFFSFDLPLCIFHQHTQMCSALKLNSS